MSDRTSQFVPKPVPQRLRVRTRAFTLIELLVVIVIIGIISAVALLSFGVLGDDRDLQREARRLASLIELANDEAMMQGRDYGIEFLQKGYRFVEFDPLTEQWLELVGDELLRPREIEESAEFDLYLEDRRVLLDDEAAEIEIEQDEDENESTGINPASFGNQQIQNADRDTSDDYAPHVLVMSSGDVTPFELEVVRRADRATVTLTMTLNGEIELESNADQRL